MPRTKSRPKHKAVNTRAVRVTCAMAVGLVLVSTGTTHALWSSTKYTSSAATVQTGTMSVERIGEPVWTDMSIPADPLVIPDMSKAAPMMQGSVYRFQQKIKSDSGTLPVNVRIDLPWLNNNLATQLDVVASLHSSSGFQIGQDVVPRTAATSGKASFAFPALAGGGVEGYVQILITYIGTDGGSPAATFTLDDIVVTLDQITK